MKVYLVSTSPHIDNIILNHYATGRNDIIKFIVNWCNNNNMFFDIKSLHIDFEKCKVDFDYGFERDNYNVKASWKLFVVERI